MRSPSGGEARCRGGTHGGKAPPSPETTLSGLTRGQVFGEDQVANVITPALPDVRPAPQAGCFVSRLVSPKTQRKSLRAIEHSAPDPGTLSIRPTNNQGNEFRLTGR